MISTSALCPILKVRYGEYYLTEAKHFLKQGGLETLLDDEKGFRQLILLNEDIRVLLFKALVQIERAYNALLIELMNDYYKGDPYWYKQTFYEKINLSFQGKNLLSEQKIELFSKKNMPAFELIGQQSFGTVVYFHGQAPEKVKK